MDDLNGAIGNGSAADYFPLLRYLPLPTHKKVKCVKAAQDFLKKHLDEHRKSYNPGKRVLQSDMLESPHSTMSVVAYTNVCDCVSECMLANRSLHLWPCGLFSVS